MCRTYMSFYVNTSFPAWTKNVRKRPKVKGYVWYCSNIYIIPICDILIVVFHIHTKLLYFSGNQNGCTCTLYNDNKILNNYESIGSFYLTYYRCERLVNMITIKWNNKVVQTIVSLLSGVEIFLLLLIYSTTAPFLIQNKKYYFKNLLNYWCIYVYKE